MQRALLRFGDLTVVALAAMLTLGTVACGDDDDDKPSKGSAKDGGTDAGGKDTDTPGMRIPTGGRGGRGGTGGAGAGGASANPSTAYTCKPRKADTGGPTASGANCCGGIGTCTASSDENAGLPHETCKSDLRCVPKPVTPDEDAGMSMWKSCRVRLPGSPEAAPSYEGRCMANCFVLGSPIASRLSQATCDEGESCAPCFNPLNGESTGICELSGDKPLEPAPPALAECGEGGTGYCVPAYAAGNSAGQLSQLTCGTGELCAPKNKVADPNACFEHCDAGAAFGPGACAPTFLAGQLTALLSVATCKTGEVCIPCEALNLRTGVCD